ncbi:hypothetical protein GGI35DRAFT_458446 [Trichoderma velutinum]
MYDAFSQVFKSILALLSCLIVMTSGEQKDHIPAIYHFDLNQESLIEHAQVHTARLVPESFTGRCFIANTNDICEWQNDPTRIEI